MRFSGDGQYYLDRYSRVDLPPVLELRRTSDQKLVMTVEKADASALLATGWRVPEAFVAKGRDGTTDIYGVIVRPTNFDAKKKYPVIEYIYAGPHDSFVPKTWGVQYGMQAQAELGIHRLADRRDGNIQSLEGLSRRRVAEHRRRRDFPTAFAGTRRSPRNIRGTMCRRSASTAGRRAARTRWARCSFIQSSIKSR